MSTIDKLFGANADKVKGKTGKKSTSAKPKMEFVLPAEKIQETDLEPVFRDIGRVLVSLDVNNLLEKNCVDLNDAYKRFNCAQITKGLAEYYYEILKLPDPDPADEQQPLQIQQIEAHNTEMVKNQQAFMAWQPTIQKWLAKYPAPFQNKKAFLVEIPVEETDLLAIKQQFSDKIGGSSYEDFAANMDQECAKHNMTQWMYLENLNTQHQLGIVIPNPLHLKQSLDKTGNPSYIGTKWQIFKRNEGEQYSSRFVNLWLRDFPVETIDQLLSAKYPNQQTGNIIGYLIADSIELNGKYWQIKGIGDVWV